MNSKRSVYSLLFGISAIAVASCDSGSTVQLDGNELLVPVPAVIRQIAALNGVPIELQISVNGQVKREVGVTDARVAFSEVVNIPADQNNNVALGWYAIVGSSEILLADYSTIVTAGTTELNIFSYNSTGARFDADSDGRTNLTEAKENRNLLSAIDLDVPFQLGFGGVFSDIGGEGVDPDISGDPREPDQLSRFSLRHDGSDLVVYVCGKDQSLQGDNIGTDGQYWHDDTVFIFVDGADSDNRSYDGVDDFQLGFVRETGEMIVSKGGNNPFCTNGACISHAFFNNSTLCTYELTVNLPLAELNMQVGTPIGFDIEITDDDNGGRREGSNAWIGFDDKSNENPSTFGTIELQ